MDPVCLPPRSSFCTWRSTSSPPQTEHLSTLLWFPQSPVDPPLRVGTIHRDQHGPRVGFIIRPDAGERPLAVAVNETARIGFVVRILLDNLSRGNGFEDLLDRNPLGGRLFVGVIGDSNAPGLYRIANQVELDQAVLLYRLSISITNTDDSRIERHQDDGELPSVVRCKCPRSRP